ncbi:hypothetical protein ACO0K7_00815 [Undibacterium sp. Ji67W]|uniref:hypothetical protein n=1 Tax=Undibacterium sp. Ji67W TaxID=3413042 RepID=UPI003BF0F980
MNLHLLTNPTVRQAIDALQRGDRAAWMAAFAPDVKMFDDGRPISFQTFTQDAVGSERFTSIDRVENGGSEVYGHFHSDRWGNFQTYFRFHFDSQGKCHRLEIGQ